MGNNEAFVISRADTHERAIRQTFASSTYIVLADAFDNQLFDNNG